MRVSHTFGHFEWTITNFALKINFQVEGLDLHKNLSSFPTGKETLTKSLKKKKIFLLHSRKWFLCLAKDNIMVVRCERTNI